MKAAIYYGPEDMRVGDISCPKPKEDQVLLKIEACGICGSDVHLYKGRMKFPVEGVSIFGHEFTGTISELGKNVSNFRIGDRVVVNPNIYCGKCFFCERGQENFCVDRRVIGGHFFGAFSEYCVADEKQLCILPDNVSFVEGALTEPISCCLNAIDNLHCKTGDCVAIVGSGGIGLLMIQLVKHSGAGTILVIEPNKKRRELAIKFGATMVIDPSGKSTEEIKQCLNVRNIDKVIECVGRPETIGTAIAIAGRGATVMIFGVAEADTEVTIKPYKVFEDELHITGSYINPYTFARAVEMLKVRRLDLSEHIKTIVKLDNIVECFTSPKYRDCAKIIIKP
jgi:L-iditol 2-dehydrogenase